MKDRFDVALLDSGAAIKKGFIHVLKHTGRVVATITFIISALVLFTDITFSSLTLESFTSTALIMLIASYLIYFSMEDAGERLGEESEEYQSSFKEYDALRSKIEGTDIEALRKYCKDYTKRELEYRRDSLLAELGISTEEYVAYKQGSLPPKGKRRALKRVERLSAITITPRELLSRRRSRDGRELFNPESAKLKGMLLKLIPTTLCMLLTVSVMLRTKSDLDTGVIIDGLIKLFSLAIVGVRGYGSGYIYTKESLPPWIDTKRRLLDAFLKEKER